MLRYSCSLTLIAFALAGAAAAQDGPAVLMLAENAAQDHLQHYSYSDDESDITMRFMSHEFAGVAKPVKNAPYTAEAVSETTQVLGDGNRIQRRTSTLLARDSQGRTRQETRRGKSVRVWLDDPVTKSRYLLQPGSKLAVKMPVVPLPPVPPVPPIPPLPPMTDADGSRAQVFVHRSSRDGKHDVQVQVIRMGDDASTSSQDAGPIPPVPPVPPIPPVVAFAMPHAGHLPGSKGSTAALGTREFDGVKAEGTSTSSVIPAGEIGNEKPITVTSERWYSPELQLVVYTRYSDPRAGETTYRLTSIKRGEPPAELFRVPADYRSPEDLASVVREQVREQMREQLPRMRKEK